MTPGSVPGIASFNISAFKDWKRSLTVTLESCCHSDCTGLGGLTPYEKGRVLLDETQNWAYVLLITALVFINLNNHLPFTEILFSMHWLRCISYATAGITHGLVYLKVRRQPECGLVYKLTKQTVTGDEIFQRQSLSQPC